MSVLKFEREANARNVRGLLVFAESCTYELAARAAQSPFRYKRVLEYCTYLAMGFANVRAGNRYPPEH